MQSLFDGCTDANGGSTVTSFVESAWWNLLTNSDCSLYNHKLFKTSCLVLA